MIIQFRSISKMCAKLDSQFERSGRFTSDFAASLDLRFNIVVV